MKLDITAEGHRLIVDIVTNPNGGFTGDVQSQDWGNGSLYDGQIEGSEYTGKLRLFGHTADFKATIDPVAKTVSGEISAFFLTKDFTGTVVS